jgi:hypothetical protein
VLLSHLPEVAHCTRMIRKHSTQLRARKTRQTQPAATAHTYLSGPRRVCNPMNTSRKSVAFWGRFMMAWWKGVFSATSFRMKCLWEQ